MGELLEAAVTGRPVYFVVPDGIDAPERVSGGNVYDQQVRNGLRRSGWEVRMVPVSGDSAGVSASTSDAIALIPGDALVLVDGLVAVRAPETVAELAGRARVVVLAHMVASALPDADDAVAQRERTALSAASCVIATSSWTRSELIARDLAEPHRIVVARPGMDAARAATEATELSATGGRLLCVAAIAPHKGHDILVRALAQLADVDSWHCTFAGSLLVSPGFVAGLEHDIASARLSDRFTFAGVLPVRQLENEYARADLVIAPSRAESYGMAVAEAAARGIPVVATRVGGLAESLAQFGGGMLVPPEDPWALALLLRQWMRDRTLRDTLKASAVQGRSGARPWSETTAIIASTLSEVALGTAPVGDVLTVPGGDVLTAQAKGAA